MIEPHDHLTGFASIVREYWHVFAGIILTIWWLLVRGKRALFSNHPTIDEMHECKDEMIVKMDKMEAENRASFQHLTDLIIRHIANK